MRPQYCGCGWPRNRIIPQLRCELKSHMMRQRNNNATAFSRNATAHRPQQTATEKGV
jgi:hypothetical protein